VSTVEVTLHTTHAVSPNPGPCMETILTIQETENQAAWITSEFITDYYYFDLYKLRNKLT